MEPWIKIQRRNGVASKILLGVSDQELEFVTIRIDDPSCRVSCRSAKLGTSSIIYSMLLYAAGTIAAFWDDGRIRSDEDIKAIFDYCKPHFTADEFPIIYNADGKCISHRFVTRS